MTLTIQDPFDTGRIRYYSNTGYKIIDNNTENVYYDAAVLESVKENFDFSETDEKIEHGIYDGYMIKITTPLNDYNLNIAQVSEKDDVRVCYGDDVLYETVEAGEAINHIYEVIETYQVCIETSTIFDEQFKDKTIINELIIAPDDNFIIGCNAFENCANLTSIKCNGNEPPSFNTDCFLNVTATVTVPKDCRDVYESALSDSGGNLTIVEEVEE